MCTVDISVPGKLGSRVSVCRIAVYSDVLIDKGNASTVIGPEEPLTGKVGDKFLVPVGKRAFINCDLADAGGFPYDSSVDPPLPARVQWFKDGEPVDLTLFSTIHGNQLCVDVRNINDTGDYMCKITSRIVDNPLADDRFQMDSATSNVMLVCKCPCVVLSLPTRLHCYSEYTLFKCKTVIFYASQ